MNKQFRNTKDGRKNLVIGNIYKLDFIDSIGNIQSYIIQYKGVDGRYSKFNVISSNLERYSSGSTLNWNHTDDDEIFTELI